MYQLAAILDSDAIAFSIVTKDLRVRRCSPDKEMTAKFEGPEVIDQTALDEHPLT
jgi:hypothetical protein